MSEITSDSIREEKRIKHDIYDYKVSEEPEKEVDDSDEFIEEDDDEYVTLASVEDSEEDR